MNEGIDGAHSHWVQRLVRPNEDQRLCLRCGAHPLAQRAQIEPKIVPVWEWDKNAAVARSPYKHSNGTTMGSFDKSGN
jgi:hypothetical protein